MIKVNLELNEIVSYVTHINGINIINDLTIRNTGETALRSIDLVIEFSDNLAQTWTLNNLNIDAGSGIKIDFRNNSIRLTAESLVNVTEGYPSSFSLLVKKDSEEVLFSETYDINVLAYNQWMGSVYHPALVSAFVTPNHPKVARILRNASEILSAWNLSSTGYATQNKDDVRAQVKAIYLALQREEIKYIVAPSSFEKFGQRIRMVDEVIDTKLGNCIEISLLFASCLEQASLNPIIILLEGHAFVGVWLEEMSFYNALEDDLSALTKRFSRGLADLEVIETTVLASPQKTSYEVAVETAEDQLVYANTFEYALDVKKARDLGMRPLPQKIEVNHEVVLEKSAETMEQMVELPPEKIRDDEAFEIATKRRRGKLKNWESKLLNLTMRNSLLNFRPVKRSVSLMEGDLETLEDLLSSGKEFDIVACPKEISSENRKEKEYSFNRAQLDANRTYTIHEMNHGRIVTLMNPKELDYAIRALYYMAKTELEENGANTLFLAMGFLKWFETDISKQARFAPILLYPIEIVRKSSISGFVMRFRDEEVQINTTLLEKLRMDHNMELPILDELPVDDNGIDIKKVFNIFRSAVIDKKGWDVVDTGYMSLFSFNQFVMWNDLKNRSDVLLENKIVSSLMEGKVKFETPQIIDVKSLDQTDHQKNSAVLMAADSSQLAAIYSSAQGSNFVLYGPPGTGKSQTITNIISTALYQGKSVLFVAEKMAALNVVKDRLESVGLGDFSLELHSNKAKKTEVLSHIGRTLDLHQNGKLKEIKEKKENLLSLRNKISEANQALHRQLDCGYSTFELISKYEAYGNIDTSVIEDSLAMKLSPQYEDTIEDLGNVFKMVFQQNQPIEIHPLSFVNISQLSISDKESIAKDFIFLKEALEQLLNSLDALNKKTDWDFISQNNIEKRLTLLSSVSHLSQVNNHFIKNRYNETPDSYLKTIISQGKNREMIYETVNQVYDKSIFDFRAIETLLEWNQSESQWFVPKFFSQSAILKKLRLYALNPKELRKEDVKSLLIMLKENIDAKKEIDAYMELNGSKFSETWKGERTDWTEFEKTINDTQNISQMMLEADGDFNVDSLEDIIENKLVKFISEEKDKIDFSIKSLSQVITSGNHLDKRIKGSALNDEDSINQNLQRINKVCTNYDMIDRWVSYIKSRDSIAEVGLSHFVLATERGNNEVENFNEHVLKSIIYKRIILEIESNPLLQAFDKGNFEVLLERYRKEMEIVREMTKIDLVEKLTRNLPSSLGAVNVKSEIGIMKKAVRSGGRGISLRKVFEQTPNVLRKVAPCMLMSPISIAQYIDPSFPEFDLIVFDEASQVFTHMAVGAIARGKNLIVVGDPKQLPPTSFFSTSNSDEDEFFEDSDQQSILDECLVTNFPDLSLDWHYRSRHESLIAFSNAQYYENKLYTFPSFNDLESKVSLVDVEGFYDRGGTKENVAEANAILAEVKRRLLDDVLRRQSIGIVTFSSIQQRLIQNKLYDMLTKFPKLDDLANSMSEEIFVKNIESVQGDERDVILFSIGYGPDQQGKVLLNFGPLNQDGGWRRLNVVISRSREEMVVFSTLKPEQIDLSRTSAIGVEGLKHFLEFARNKNSLSISSSIYKSREDEVVESIAKHLEARGHRVKTNIGKSNFRVDLGIVSSTNENEFIAAIILDGSNYNETATVRDRIIVQPSVLGGLGWNVIRVWSLEWFRNRENVLDDIEDALQEILNNAEIDLDSEVKQVEYVIERHEVEERELTYYRQHFIENKEYEKDSFYEGKSRQRMIAIMDEIVEKESPVVQEDLYRRVISHWNITQLGSKIRRILDEASQGVDAYRITSDFETVYWKSKDQEEDYKLVRYYQDDKRTFEYICMDEISNTVVEVLENQISLDSENLLREIFKCHGYVMLGEKARDRVYAILMWQVENGDIIEETGRFMLTP